MYWDFDSAYVCVSACARTEVCVWDCVCLCRWRKSESLLMRIFISRSTTECVLSLWTRWNCGLINRIGLVCIVIQVGLHCKAVQSNLRIVCYWKVPAAHEYSVSLSFTEVSLFVYISKVTNMNSNFYNRFRLRLRHSVLSFTEPSLLAKTKQVCFYLL